MSFLSIEFIVFFIALILVYGFMPIEKGRQITLLLFSLFFYCYADWRFCVLLVGLALVAWLTGVLRNKTLVIIGVIAAVMTLGVFKYFNFFISSFVAAFDLHNFDTIKIILPLGISFYTFQAISYILDVYWGKVPAEEKFWKVLLYISFFPQITAGPIVKARDFLPQLEKEHIVTKSSFSEGIQRITLGVFKKTVIADRIGVAVNAVYSAPNQYSGISLLMASVGYAIQIYCDFSGYSDMAIGIAEIFGYDLGRNFELPYIASNPSDFWRRWHISLSTWFRDYVYIPCGGSRKGKARTYFNLFLTMLLSGLWHGANWTYVFWGALHGLFSMCGKAITDYRKNSGKQSVRAVKILGIVITQIIVWLLWIPFRASSINQALEIYSRIFTMKDGIPYVSVFVVVYFLFIMTIQIFAMVKHEGKVWWKPLDFSYFWHIFWYTLLVLLIIVFSYIGDTAFIYAQF